MVDEMDLLSDLKDAESVRPRAYEEARAVLRAAMAVEGAPETTTAPRPAAPVEHAPHGGRQRRRPGRRGRGGGAGRHVCVGAQP